ncbi:recombinase family protein [Enterococcus sp. AZ192]|uniref:recombinase family protein n=1 Tax=unclassified Enterococcus TaxID=2608891 RepID=UPI003D28727D
MIYGYARVSTKAQSLGEQLEQLKQAGVSKENVYKEKFTGTKINRPEFTKLLSILEDNDTVVVTKLDRFARNTKEALEVIEPLLERNITIKVLNLGTIENTTIGRMIMRTILSVAEMERDMIVERTQEGKAFAKRNNPNFREGRPKAKITDDKLHAYELLKSGLSYKEVSKRTRLSVSTIQRVKRNIEFPMKNER